MKQPDRHNTAVEPILDRLDRLMSTVTVFGDPIEHNGLTVIPAARVTAGGGGGRGIDQGAAREGDGGGAGLLARPTGVFVINDGQVTWKPAINIETLATLAMLAIIWLARSGRGGHPDLDRGIGVVCTVLPVTWCRSSLPAVRWVWT